jgi:hypothetical protein
MVTPDKLTELAVDVLVAADASEAEAPMIVELSDTSPVITTATRRRQTEPLAVGDCRRITVLILNVFELFEAVTEVVIPERWAG